MKSMRNKTLDYYEKHAKEYAAGTQTVPFREMRFQGLSSTDRYNGIWACASLLHLPKWELADVFGRISAALRSEGVLYASFKYGTNEGERGGRYFTDFDEEEFRRFAEPFPELVIRKLWTSADARPDREDER